MVEPPPIQHDAASPQWAAAKRLAPVLAKRAREFEDARCLPDDIVRAFVDAGMVQMAVPQVYGGLESHALDLLRVIEEISYGDGSAGWVLMNYQTTALVSGLLPKRWGEAIFAQAEPAVPAGVLALTGRGRREAGGLRASGRWRFASGVPGANWLLGTVVMEGGGSGGSGASQVLLPMFPRKDVAIHDTWDVVGLCGSGSHDVEVREVFVPEGRWISLGDPPAVETTLYQIPIITLFPPCVVAVSLGIARAALESFAALAADKVPTQSRTSLAERPSAQVDFAKAEARIDAARCHVYETTGALWDEVERRGEAQVETRRRVRLASTHAAVASTEAVDLLYTAAGTSSIFSEHPLQRHWRDIHTTTQHIQIAQGNYGAMGRLRLTGSSDGAPL